MQLDIYLYIDFLRLIIIIISCIKRGKGVECYRDVRNKIMKFFVESL